MTRKELIDATSKLWAKHGYTLITHPRHLSTPLIEMHKDVATPPAKAKGEPYKGDDWGSWKRAPSASEVQSCVGGIEWTPSQCEAFRRGAALVTHPTCEAPTIATSCRSQWAIVGLDGGRWCESGLSCPVHGGRK